MIVNTPLAVFCRNSCRALESIGIKGEQLELFYKKDVLNNFSIFIGKDLSFQACSCIKKRLQHRCLPLNIAKFLRTPILKTVRILLL